MARRPNSHNQIRKVQDASVIPSPPPIELTEGEKRLAELSQVRKNIRNWIDELEQSRINARRILKTSKDSIQIATIALELYDQEINIQFKKNVKESQTKGRK